MTVKDLATTDDIDWFDVREAWDGLHGYLNTHDLQGIIDDYDASMTEADDAIAEASEFLESLDPDDDGYHDDKYTAERIRAELIAEREAYRHEHAKLVGELARANNEVPEWHHGETLIPDDEFIDYAQQLAEDIGALANCEQWPATCIDWERAAGELKADYSSIEIDGTEYLFRA